MGLKGKGLFTYPEPYCDWSVGSWPPSVQNVSQKITVDRLQNTSTKIIHIANKQLEHDNLFKLVSLVKNSTISYFLNLILTDHKSLDHGRAKTLESKTVVCA